MQVKQSMFWAIALISLFVLQSTSPLLHPVGVDIPQMESQGGIEWVQFDLVDDVYSDAIGYSDLSTAAESREVIASSRIGTFDVNGLQLERPVPDEWMTPRFDLSLVLVSCLLKVRDLFKTMYLLVKIIIYQQKQTTRVVFRAV